MKKNLIKIVCFMSICALLFFCFHKVFNFKYGDGIYSLTKFYEEPEDSIDVLCFGSSHIFENVNTGILWEEYGIASFNLCGSIQPMWNSYYYMKEALKTQEPKLMILDVFGATQTEEYIDHSRIIKNNYGLKPSRDKIGSVIASSPEESRIGYLLEYPTYHSRYSEIGRADFAEHTGRAIYKNWKGFGINTNTTSYSEPKSFYTDETAGLTDKVEQYLLKIIQLSKEHNIPLLLIKAPNILNQNQQKVYNKIAEIANENDIPFINFNLLYHEIGLDFSTDYADTSHLNHLGNAKFTRYLAEYLKESYDLPDRRGDAGYESYGLMAADCRQIVYNFELTQIEDIGNYIDKALAEDYVTVYWILGDYKNISNYDAVKSKLASTLGIDLDTVSGDAAWVIQNGGILFSGTSEEAFEWHTALGEDNNLMVSCPAGPESKIEVNLSHTVYEPVSSGLNVLVYDTRTETLVESAGFGISNNSIVYEKKTAEE